MWRARPDPSRSEATTQTGHEQRFGSFQMSEVLRESADWLLVKCRRDDGALAVVKTAQHGSKRARQTLRREAALLLRLAVPGHDGVVRILEQAAVDEPAWYATEWLSGRPLSRVRGTNSVPLLRAVRVGRSIALALEYVHSHGIIHGDLSPANVLVDDDGRATLIDFGAAAQAFDADSARELVHAGDPRYGTPGYIAPERVSHGIVDARSDLYSLGCLLYELVTGRAPFHDDHAATLARQHVESAPTPPGLLRPDLPPALEGLILKLLQKDPARRCASASEVCAALAVLDPEQPSPVSGARTKHGRLHRSRLVGREQALRALTGRIERCEAGEGGLVVVSGESGIGKTRLLNEAARHASERGFEVLFGHCHHLVPSRGGASKAAQALGPFLPFLAWFADVQRKDGRAPSDDLKAACAVLAAYEPSLHDAAAVAKLASLPAELGRARVLQSLAKVMVAASSQAPLLLIIDDVQWADDLTIAFLCSDQAHGFAGANSCVVVAYRSDELSDDLQQRLAAKALASTHLERLTLDDVSALARVLLGSQVVPAQVAEFLQRHSGGNPFLVVEYLFALLQRGALRAEDESGTSTLDLGGQSLAIPAGLKELFELRVAQLSLEARRVLELSAVLGAEFQRKLLAVSTRRMAPDFDTTTAVEELCAQRLLELLPGDRCRFVHDKLREAQLQALEPERRRALHRQAADVLSSDQRFPATPAELGLHWAEAGLPERACPHLAVAAEQAARRYANAEAIDLYGLALEQHHASPATLRTEETRTRASALAEARGDVLLRSGRNREAAEQYGAVLASADRAGRARLKRKQGFALRTAHDYEAAAAALESAAEALAPGDASVESHVTEEWIEIQQERFWLHYFARRAGPLTEAVLERMRPVVQQYGTARQRSSFFECAASHLMARDRYLFSDAAVASARRAMSELGGALEHAGQAAGARFVLAFSLVLGTREHCSEAVELFETTLTELEPIGDPMLISRSLVYQSIAHRRLGHAEAVKVGIERARRYAERARLTHYLGACLACDAWLCWRDGEPEQAEQLANEAVSWWRKGTHVFPFRWLANFVLLDAQHLRDDFAGARLVLDDLLEPTQKRFEEPLATALAAARQACLALEARDASRQVLAVLQLAHREGYL
jgi:hypothetical protein